MCSNLQILWRIHSFTLITWSEGIISGRIRRLLGLQFSFEQIGIFSSLTLINYHSDHFMHSKAFLRKLCLNVLKGASPKNCLVSLETHPLSHPWVKTDDFGIVKLFAPLVNQMVIFIYGWSENRYSGVESEKVSVSRTLGILIILWINTKVWITLPVYFSHIL